VIRLVEIIVPPTLPQLSEFLTESAGFAHFGDFRNADFRDLSQSQHSRDRIKLDFGGIKGIPYLNCGRFPNDTI
jgi:hypothetical protein